MTKIDPNKMMAQLGKMQEQMAQAQEERSGLRRAAGGGAVTVKASGSLEITDITIKPEGRPRRPGDARISSCQP